MPDGEVVGRADGHPIAGIVVSDGLTVTRTRDDGTFSVPARDDAEFVWVTVPSRYQALVPGWFVDVRDGAAAEPLRFELEPRAEPAQAGCRFVQVTDLHVSIDEGARLRPLIEAGVVAPPGVDVTGDTTAEELRADLETIVARVAPDFVAATGDLADYGQREELEAYRDVIAHLGVPVASIPGNHDHLSVLTRQAIDEFFSEWATRDNTEGLDAGAAFQREVFGGNWRRAKSGRVPWTDVMGPLYYSFDWGGVHFVAYDGEGLRRYGDDYPQDQWLARDLAAVAPDTPVFVCTHFPEDREFYRSRFAGVRLVASLSGHWHGTRVWQDGDAVHWTSSTLGFGGIDYTPRGYRVVEVDADGARSRWETIEAPSASSLRVAGRAATSNGHVVVAREAGDATGTVTALGSWTSELRAAARGGVVADDRHVYFLDLGARVTALDVHTGEVQWSHDLGDPSVRWSLGVPVVQDGHLYVGSPMSVHAFDAGDGAELWRTDLAPADWAASWSGVTARDGNVVIGAVNDELHLAALDADSGALRWRHSGRDIAGVSATPAIAGDAVVAARAPGWLAAHALDDGARRWKAPLDDAWPVAVAIADDLAIVRSSSAIVSAHDLTDGALRWTCRLDPGPRAARPYARAPGGARFPLVVVGERVWTATHDSLVAIDTATGKVASRTRSATDEVATVVAIEDTVAAVTITGDVLRPA
jgi:outer membrane protein assembly factor BamB/predicted MPP superfamily phosphohydrolase